MADTMQSAICLPSELWLEIFGKNTERDVLSHNRLKTAHHCSQVCRLWRTILLSSSSIWGRLLQMDYFENSKSEWKELILSRIGNALLWIHGPIPSSTWQFFLTVAGRNWQNVQILDVQQYSLTRICAETGAFFGNPAPNLEVFALTLFYKSPFPKSLTLFSNVAPRLREFETSPFFSDVKPTFPWLARLHRISFHSQYSSATILSVLKRMPCLKFLRIQRKLFNMDEPVPDNSVPVHLPQLQCMHVNDGDRAQILPFLELITPSPMCTLVLRTTWPSSFYSPVDLYEGVEALPSRFHRALLPWIVAYMKGRAPAFICLGVDDSDASFSIHNYSPHTYEPWSQIVEEILSIDIQLDSYCRFALAELGASSGSFSSVTELSLLVEPDKHDALLPLYEAFTSVAELTLVADTIDFTALQMDRKHTQSVLFPQLHSLHVFFYRESPQNDKTLSSIIDFVEFRTGVGLPLSYLDLSESDLKLSDSDKERLGKFADLTVKLPASRASLE